MIELRILNSQQVEDFINGRAPRVIEGITREMQRQMVLLQAKVVGEKLSGQVLKTRTGTLRRSIGQAVEAGAETVLGTVFADPSVPYAKVHEYGGTRAYVIEAQRAKALRFIINGRPVFRKRVNHPPLPMRSFMRTSLAERRSAIVAGLSESIQAGL